MEFYIVHVANNLQAEYGITTYATEHGGHSWESYFMKVVY